MSEKEIFDKLKEIISKYVPQEVDTDNIGMETDLLQDLKVNSAHLVDIILDLEDEFDLEISDDDAEKMLKVGAALEIVTAGVQQK